MSLLAGSFFLSLYRAYLVHLAFCAYLNGRSNQAFGLESVGSCGGEGDAEEDCFEMLEVSCVCVVVWQDPSLNRALDTYIHRYITGTTCCCIIRGSCETPLLLLVPPALAGVWPPRAAPRRPVPCHRVTTS